MNNKTHGLNAASQRKHEDTLKRVMDALKIMEKESIPINFLSVFKFTGVARSWLYKEPSIREIIKKAKNYSNNRLMQDQALQLQTKNREIDILAKQNKLLRKQIDELRQQLEVAYAAFYKQEE
jgi:predicted RNase H-like nuclease